MYWISSYFDSKPSFWDCITPEIIENSPLGTFTNIGRKKMYDLASNPLGPKPVFFIALLQGMSPWLSAEDISELSQVSFGTGYYAQEVKNIVPIYNGMDLEVLHLGDFSWKAKGGPLSNISYVALFDDTGTVYTFWILGNCYSVTDGHTLTLEKLEIRLR